LKFYASHLADLTFAKEKAKWMDQPVVTRQLTAESSQSDDDFGDDEDVEPAPVPKIEKPLVKPKPIQKQKKPPIPEKSIVKAEKSENEKAAAEVAEKLKILEENVKTHATDIRRKEKRLHEMDEKISEVLEQLKASKLELEQKRKNLDRLKKTNQLLNDSDDGLEKLKKAVEAQVAKLVTLASTWDEHRRPLIEDIRKKRSNANNKVSTGTSRLKCILLL